MIKFAYDIVGSDFYYNQIGDSNVYSTSSITNILEYTQMPQQTGFERRNLTDFHIQGNLPYWFSINNIEIKIVSVEDALKSEEKFIYTLNSPCLATDFMWLNLSRSSLKLVKAINKGQCKFVLNDSREGSVWTSLQIKKFELYLKNKMRGIDPQEVIVISQNYNYNYHTTFPFKMIVWQFMESFFRVKSEDWVEYNVNAKKFLCLNRWPHDHKFYFMYQMWKHNILDQFNFSFSKIENPDTFEKWDVWEWTDDLVEFAKGTPYNYDMPVDDANWSLDPHHKKDSLLYIVTETFFNNYQLNCTYRDVSEKTWKPIAMQMPFILVHQPFALRRLRDLGYKTFHTLWNEDYDDIVDDKKRMSAIVDLVVSLNSRKDFVELIKSCRGIVEHNFQMLRMRRPESDMIRALSR